MSIVLVQISKGGVIHLREDSDLTLCGRQCQEGKRMDHEGIKASCQRCIKIYAAREPVKVEAAMQTEGARMGRQGVALMGNIPMHSGEAAKLAFTHGWMTHHESCDCKISGGVGYTYDCATHEMVKNPPARQYTPHQMSLARRRYEPGTWRSKHKGSKGKRVLSHA